MRVVPHPITVPPDQTHRPNAARAAASGAEPDTTNTKPHGAGAKAAKGLEPSTALSGETAVTTQMLSSDEPDAAAVELPAGPGKSGSSPAMQARAYLAANPDHSGVRFGQIVSSIARGIDPGAPDDGAADGEEPVVDAATGDDPATAPVVDDPQIEAAPAGDETTDPLAALDPDAALVTDTTVAESLIDILDETSGDNT